MAPTWLITGSSSGFGLALVRYCLSQGHNVIATSRNPGGTPDLVQEVISHPNGRWRALDVTAPRNEIDRALEEAWQDFEGIDYLVNNAGYSILGAAEDIPEDGARTQFEVNFWGAVRTSQSLLPRMRARRSGTIINISSVAGVDPLPTCAIYAASKFALEAWSESLAAEIKPLGMRVLVIEPGAFKTNFFSGTAMQFVPPSAEYSDDSNPVSKTLAKFKAIDPSKFPDPSKAAQKIFEVAVGVGAGKSMLDSFLRVPLGVDCYERVLETQKRRQKNLDVIKTLALSAS
jgi:NAD(P)-dependent dehydrogenase (short-subunit alcohol dehydrogenase family)